MIMMMIQLRLNLDLTIVTKFFLVKIGKYHENYQITNLIIGLTIPNEAINIQPDFKLRV